MIPLKIEKSYIPEESFALFKASLESLKLPFESGLAPWVPIGNLGPVLILGHYDLAQPMVPFLIYQKYIIDKRAYLDILEHLESGYDEIDLSRLHIPSQTKEITDLSQAIAAKGVIGPKSFWDQPEDIFKEKLKSINKYLQGALVCDPRAIILPAEEILTEATKKRFHALCISHSDKEIAVCTSDSFTLELKDQILLKTTKKPIFALTFDDLIQERTEILKKLSRLKHVHTNDNITRTNTDADPKNARLKIDSANCAQVTPESLENNIEGLLEWVVYQAYIQEASDIHFEQLNGQGRVRFRIDGQLKVILPLSLENMRSLVNVALNTCKMQQGDSMNQDSSFTADINGDTISIRANAIPFRDSFPKLTYRILPKNSQKIFLKELISDESHLAIFQRAITRPQGLILITGPTGEGKTTTLYACLEAINSPDINIQTIEDPIERELEGINQTQVNVKKEVTFAKVMRSVVRQDPDVILLGEIRDKESAELAIEAALTGHLVFSTLHANSALKAISRLLQLGLPSYLFADSLLLIQAQRLARKLCPHCRKKRSLEPQEIAIFDQRAIILKDNVVYEPAGCSRCGLTGSSGRTALMEIIQFDEELSNKVAQNDRIGVLKAHIDSTGFRSFFKDALVKASSGTISLTEALRFEPAWEQA